MKHFSNLKKLARLITLIALITQFTVQTAQAANQTVNLSSYTSLSLINTAVSTAMALVNDGETLTVTGSFGSLTATGINHQGTVTFNIPAGRTVIWSGAYLGTGDSHNSTPLVTITGSGIFRMAGGQISTDRSASGASAVRVNGGIFEMTGAADLYSAAGQNTSPVLSVNSTNGGARISGGTIMHQSQTDLTRAIVVDAGALHISGSPTIRTGSTVNTNWWTITMNTGTALFIQGTPNIGNTTIGRISGATNVFCYYEGSANLSKFATNDWTFSGASQNVFPFFDFIQYVYCKDQSGILSTTPSDYPAGQAYPGSVLVAVRSTNTTHLNNPANLSAASTPTGGTAVVNFNTSGSSANTSGTLVRYSGNMNGTPSINYTIRMRDTQMPVIISNRSLVNIITQLPVVTVTTTGLTGLKVGVPVSGSVTYTLSGGPTGHPAQYAASQNMTMSNFDASFIPPISGLSIGTPVRTSNTAVTVSITGTPTAHTTTQNNRTPADIRGSNFLNGINTTPWVTPTGTITASAIAKGDGATAAIPTMASRTITGITVNAVTLSPNPGSQTVQYAISTSTTVPTTGWQATTAFTGLNPNTDYYVFARAAESANWAAGTAARSAIITTLPQPVITINTQPLASGTFTFGSISGSRSVVASVSPAGSSTLSYQWYSNTTNSNVGGTAVSGATSASFTIPTTLNAGTYYYFCEVRGTNGAASVRSNVATINVISSEIPIDNPSIISGVGWTFNTGSVTYTITGDGVAVTGTVTGGTEPTRTFNIAEGKTAVWQASLTGSAGTDPLANFTGTGTVEMVNNGAIIQTGAGNAIQTTGNIAISGNARVTAASGTAISIRGTNCTVTVSGGEVTSASAGAISASTAAANANIIISGGTVKGNSATLSTINVENSTADLTISGTGKVEQAGAGAAIRTIGNVEIKDNAEVSANAGSAIRADGENSAVTVSGGIVKNNSTATNVPTINISHLTNTALNVTVSGNGKVEQAGSGQAIQTRGNVEIKDEAEVSATTENAIFILGANSTITVNGGVVKNNSSTNPTIYISHTNNTGLNATVSGTGKVEQAGTWTAIFTYGNVEIKDEAQVSAIGGNAIYTFGANNKVTVSGGVVKNNSADNPTIIIANASNTGNNITISGTGKVEQAGSSYAIQTEGNVDVKDNAQISATTGYAIYGTGNASTVTVSGGTVSATTGRAIYTFGAGSAVTVGGTGKVQATGDAGRAIQTTGNVKVEDAAEVSATTGYAIYASGTASAVTVGGGTVSATTGTAISTDKANSTITVNSTGKVKATDSDGHAIRTTGNVKVEDNAEVSATTGRAISAEGATSAVTVNGGTVSATTGFAIHVSGATSTVTVNEGTVSATGGKAIYVTWANTVTVNGGTVSGTTGITIHATGTASTIIVNEGTVSATTGRAIFASGASAKVFVAGGTVTNSSTNNQTIWIDNASNTGLNVTISGTGKVEQAGSWIAIQTNGSVEVKDNAEVTANAGIAIHASGTNSTVSVSENAQVTATNGSAIYAGGANSVVTVSGNAQVTATDGIAVYANGTNSVVSVSENAQVTETTGTAILATGAASTVTVSGGIVKNNSSTNPTISIIDDFNNTILTVSGTGKVVQAGSNRAIRTRGNVEIKDNAQVTATTGEAIYAAGAGSKVTVGGGIVKNNSSTNPTINIDNTNNTGLNVTVSGTGKVEQEGSSHAIQTDGSVEVKDNAQVSANDVSAIYANGNVDVKDNAKVSATTGSAIVAAGANSKVTISGGLVKNEGSSNPTIYITYSNTGDNITVSGTGKVEQTGSGDAIDSNGNVEIKDNAEVSATTGRAIVAAGAASTVTVSGGTVSTTTGSAIVADGANSKVTVSGGTVRATTGRAIYAGGAGSKVTVSGGVVFAYGDAITGDDNVIYTQKNPAGFTAPTGTGVVIAWNQAAGNTQYGIGATTDITMMPAGSAAWDIRTAGEVFMGGIAYVNGANEGFIPLAVTVVPVYNVTIGTYANGSVSANKTTLITEDETVTLAITPDAGYELEHIGIYPTGDNGTIPTPIPGEGNTRTFAMPDFDVTVTAIFKCTHDYTALGTLITAATCENAAVHKAKCSRCNAEHATLTLNGAAALTGCVAINATNFPDANFRAYIETQFDKDGDKWITANEIAAITNISVSNKGIADLTGIEHFTALIILNCGFNQIETLNVSALTNLTTLVCAANKLSELNVSTLTNLTYLDCASNKLSELNVSALTKLTYLDCNNNQLTELNVSPLVNLTILFCGINQLTELNVSALVNLEALSCYNNQLTELNVSALTKLEALSCNGNYLAELDLSNNMNLTFFNGYDQTPTITITDKCGGAASGVLNVEVKTGMFLSGTITYNYTGAHDYSGEGSLVSAATCTNAAVHKKRCVNGCNADHATETMLVGNVLACVAINAVNFPDANFRKYVEDNFDPDGDKWITGEEISLIMVIEVPNKDIADLTGIELFTELNMLTCYSNKLETLDVSALVNLTSFNCDGNHLASIDLSNNTQLIIFGGNNQTLTATKPECGGIESEDFEIEVKTGMFLRGAIVFNYTGTHDYSGQGSLVSAATCTNAAVHKKRCVNGCNADHATETMLVGDVLAGCVAINETNFPDANFRAYIETYYDWDGDKWLTAQEIAGVTYIGVEESNIADLTGIEHFTALEYLSCYSNKLETLDVSALVNLEVLDCSDNRLASLNLSNNTQLWGFGGNNQTLTTTKPECGGIASEDFVEETGITGALLSGTITYNYTGTHNYSGQGSLISAATCQSPAVYAKRCVNACNADHATETMLVGEIDENNHDTEHVSAIAATCTATGISEGVKCLRQGCTHTTSAETPVLTCIAINAQNFPDANFRAIVEKDYDHDGDKWLSEWEISGTTNIDVSKEEIADLTGIEHFTELKYLTCYTNKLETLDVSALVNLIVLNCADNRLASLNLLNNTKLTGFNGAAQTLTITKPECGGIASEDFVEETGITGMTLSGTILFNYTGTHSYTALGTLVTAADCENAAVHKAQCSLCGAEHKTLVLNGIVALEHNYPETWTVRTAAKCGIAGLEFKVCTREGCGHEITQAIQALQHDFDNWKVTTPATCTAEGVETRICKNDASHTETKPIAKLAHTFVWTVTTAPTCTTEGEETQICSVCQAKGSTRSVAKVGESFSEWLVSKPATCSEAGEETRSKCNDGVISNETRPIAKLAHTFVWTVTTKPTCTANGEETQICSVCQAKDDSKKIDAIGHDFDIWKVTTPATCTAEGVETRICKNDATHTETKPIAKLAHTFVWTVTTAPTCTTEGEETQICSVCQAKGSTRSVAKVGESFGEWLVSKPATCSEAGEETRSKCNDGVISNETRPVAKTPHTFTEWKETTAPTCTTEGVETEKCAICGVLGTVTRPVTKTAHTFTTWQVTQEPTCTTEGVETEKCAVCVALGTVTRLIPQLTDDDECRGTVEIVEVENTGIKIYPNPVKNELHIVGAYGIRPDKTIQITDISGRTVFLGVCNTPLQGGTINVSALPQGVYFIKLETNKGIVTKKFIKE